MITGMECSREKIGEGRTAIAGRSATSSLDQQTERKGFCRVGGYNERNDTVRAVPNPENEWKERTVQAKHKRLPTSTI